MNWKRILIVGLCIALVGVFIASTGGIEWRADLIAILTPITIFALLVVLIINTVYQSKILSELRELNQKTQE